VAAIAVGAVAVVGLAIGGLTAGGGGGDPSSSRDDAPVDDPVLDELLNSPGEQDEGGIGFAPANDQDVSRFRSLPCRGAASVTPIAETWQRDFRDGGALIWDAFMVTGLMRFAPGDGVVWMDDLRGAADGCSNYEQFSRVDDFTAPVPVAAEELYFHITDSDPSTLAVIRVGNIVAVGGYTPLGQHPDVAATDQDMWSSFDPILAELRSEDITG